jgi:hypothetical protein
MKRNTNIADRGKYAEGKTREVLEHFKRQYAAFDYERVYDARSSMGRLPKRPGDFEFYAPKTHGLIEAKEVDHAFRLPAKNLTQIPKLRMRELAGGLIFVLVYFTPVDRWRSIPLNWLQLRQAQPSWDLTEFRLLASAAECLQPLEMTLCHG